MVGSGIGVQAGLGARSGLWSPSPACCKSARCKNERGRTIIELDQDELVGGRLANNCGEGSAADTLHAERRFLPAVSVSSWCFVGRAPSARSFRERCEIRAVSEAEAQLHSGARSSGIDLSIADAGSMHSNECGCAHPLTMPDPLLLLLCSEVVIGNSCHPARSPLLVCHNRSRCVTKARLRVQHMPLDRSTGQFQHRLTCRTRRDQLSTVESAAEALMRTREGGTCGRCSLP